MKEKGILLIALSMLMMAFIATSFTMQGYFVKDVSREKAPVECVEDLVLLDGTYVVPCEGGELVWEKEYVLGS